MRGKAAPTLLYGLRETVDPRSSQTNAIGSQLLLRARGLVSQEVRGDLRYPTRAAWLAASSRFAVSGKNKDRPDYYDYQAVIYVEGTVQEEDGTRGKHNYPYHPVRGMRFIVEGSVTNDEESPQPQYSRLYEGLSLAHAIDKANRWLRQMHNRHGCTEHTKSFSEHRGGFEREITSEQIQFQAEKQLERVPMYLQEQYSQD